MTTNTAADAREVLQSIVDEGDHPKRAPTVQRGQAIRAMIAFAEQVQAFAHFERDHMSPPSDPEGVRALLAAIDVWKKGPSPESEQAILDARALLPIAPDGDGAAVRRLVIAARVVAFEDQGTAALRELDQASEAFADRVPWENPNA